MSAILVIREDRGPITILTMNRPDWRMPFHVRLLAQLRDAVERIECRGKSYSGDGALTGAGTAFCAAGLMDLRRRPPPSTLPRFGGANHRAASGVRRSPPAGAYVVEADDRRGQWRRNRGWCRLDGGLRCRGRRRESPDRLPRGPARPGCRDGHARPGASGRRAPGERIALERRLDLEQGLRDWGLVNTVATDERYLEEAIRVAEHLAESGPLAVATTKKLLDEAAGRPGDLRGAAAISAATRLSDEAEEGIRAFIEKRPPAWAWSVSEEKTP